MCQFRDRRTLGTSYRATGKVEGLRHWRSEAVRQIKRLWRKAAP